MPNPRKCYLFSRKLAFVDFQLNAHRTDDYSPRLYFKSGNISALGHTFTVRLWVSGIDPMYPTRSPTRHLEYQVILKGTGRGNDEEERIPCMELSHILATPPPGRYFIRSVTHSDTLSQSRRDGGKYRLDIEPLGINMILASQTITLRLFLFVE